MPSNNPPTYSWRRMQLENMDSAEIDAICDPAIGTADSILKLPPPANHGIGLLTKRVADAS